MGNKHLLFNLSPDFVETYDEFPEDWDILPKLVFLRTYSRVKSDGGKETWREVVQRVVEGCYSEQYAHARQMRLPWSWQKAHASAKEMFNLIYHRKFTPPGRGLWMMGTKYVHGDMHDKNREIRGACINNCAFTSTADGIVDPMAFLMDASMLGIGVGFDTEGQSKFTVFNPLRVDSPLQGDGEHLILSPFSGKLIISDTREGWVESTRKLLSAYLEPNKPRPVFDYSAIRKAGEPIKGFGGTSAGPGPLIELHDMLNKLLSSKVGKTLTSRDITDIGNMIGRCVVSGNVRRSAEICFSRLDDKDFINLKDFNLPENKERMGPDGWGWLSNNSLTIHDGETVDYDWLAERLAQNGEPGLFFIDKARQYGRLEDKPDSRDYRVKGANPCNEQSLEDGEICCLVETYPARCNDFAEFKRVLKFAYLYGKTVTLLPTHWEDTNAIVMRNRRIGTSVSGLAQFVETRGWDELRTWLDEGYKEVQYRDHQYSEWMCVRPSIKTTSVKPSGTVSLLSNSTPGVHWPVASAYIRRIRFGKDDPLVTILRESGYKVEPAFGNSKTTVVVELPVRGPQVRSEGEVSVFEKFALAALLQRYWADNQVSLTVTFDPQTQKEDLAAALKIYDGQLKGLSALPINNDSYPQMPYEKITENEYTEMMEGIVDADFSMLINGGGEEAVEAVGESYCETDACEIKLPV